MELAPRILFVFNSPNVGGAERHTIDLAEGLASLGCLCTIFAIKPGPLKPSALTVLLQPIGSRSLVARISDLCALIKTDSPDLIVSVNERAVFVTSVARSAARSRVPIVSILHSTILNNLRERLLQVIYTPFFNRVESLVFVSNNQCEYWLHNGLAPRQHEVIYNGIDLERFNPKFRTELRASVRTRLGLADSDLVLGLCAVMRPEKNHMQLLECIAGLRRQGINAKAILIGDGPQRPFIEKGTRKLGLESAVIFVGMVDDVRPFLAALDVGVLCSISIETLSLAALEIMAMGIPVVMSDLGGASEIIDGENGRLFAVGDDKGLEKAVLSFSTLEARQSAGSAARKKVEIKFNRQKMINSYYKYFVSLAERRMLR